MMAIDLFVKADVGVCAETLYIDGGKVLVLETEFLLLGVFFHESDVSRRGTDELDHLAGRRLRDDYIAVRIVTVSRTSDACLDPRREIAQDLIPILGANH